MHLAALTGRHPTVPARRTPPQVRRAVIPAEPGPPPSLHPLTNHNRTSQLCGTTVPPSCTAPAHSQRVGWGGGPGCGFTCQCPNSEALLLGHLDGGASCAWAPACSPPAACHEGAAAGGPRGSSGGWTVGPPPGASPPTLSPAATWTDASPPACRALPLALCEASGGVRETAAVGGGRPHPFTCSASCHCCASVKPGG